MDECTIRIYNTLEGASNCDRRHSCLQGLKTKEQRFQVATSIKQLEKRFPSVAEVGQRERKSGVGGEQLAAGRKSSGEEVKPGALGKRGAEKEPVDTDEAKRARGAVGGRSGVVGKASGKGVKAGALGRRGAKKEAVKTGEPRRARGAVGGGAEKTAMGTAKRQGKTDNDDDDDVVFLGFSGPAVEKGKGQEDTGARGDDKKETADPEVKGKLRLQEGETEGSGGATGGELSMSLGGAQNEAAAAEGNRGADENLKGLLEKVVMKTTEDPEAEKAALAATVKTLEDQNEKAGCRNESGG